MTNGRITSNFRRASPGDEPKLEERAGRCVQGKQHRWGMQENRRDYTSRVRYDIPCFRCPRVQVVQYGHSGSRPIGYYTRSGEAA